MSVVSGLYKSESCNFVRKCDIYQVVSNLQIRHNYGGNYENNYLGRQYPCDLDETENGKIDLV